ncbi:MAG TPA: hypothetical protein VF519_15930 [Mycobacteriales bacterium]|jgi:hypothetical protein
MKRALTSRCVVAALAGAFVLAGCGEARQTDQITAAAPSPVAATAAATMTLADVAKACRASGSSPGVAIVDRELRDANTSVTLPDCILHLEKGADVWLNNVRIGGGVLNIHDRETAASANRVELQRVTVNAAALLVELNDPDDSINAEATQVTTARGIGVRVAGTRNGTNTGGTITFVDSTLLATGREAPVHVLASEHSGTITLVETTLDTQGSLTVLAATCEARRGGRKLDCSTAAAEAGLRP